LSCYYCKKAGHVSKDCPELRNKIKNAPCYKCRKPGHLSKNCQESPIDWEMDIDFPEVNKEDDSNQMMVKLDTPTMVVPENV